MPIAKKHLRNKRRNGKSESLSNLTLPTDLVEPPKYFTDYTTLIFGKKAVGKTSLIAQWPDAIVNQFETGRTHLPILQVPKPKEKPLNWKRFKHYLELELNDDRIRSVGVDTIDRAWECCIKFVCEQSGIRHPNDANDYGKTWQACSDEFETTLNQIKQAGKSPVFVSHGKLKPVYDVLKDESVEMFIPTCPERCWLYLQTVADFVFCYTTHGAQRVLVCRPTDTVMAACGPPNTFMHRKSGRPLLEISMGSSPAEAFKLLTAAYENKGVGRCVPINKELSEDAESHDETEDDDADSVGEIETTEKKSRRKKKFQRKK